MIDFVMVLASRNDIIRYSIVTVVGTLNQS